MLSKDEEKWIYSTISAEIISMRVDNALWAKAFSESEGDLDRSKAKYIKYRFKEIELDIINNKKEVKRKNMKKF